MLIGTVQLRRGINLPFQLLFCFAMREIFQEGCPCLLSEVETMASCRMQL